MIKNVNRKAIYVTLIVCLLFIIVGFAIYFLHNKSIEKIHNIDNASLDVYFNKEIKQSQVKINENQIIDYMAVIEIPKIKLKQGIPYINSKDNNSDRNIMVIKESDMPDKDGGVFILASHSGTSTISYFKDLYKLNKNDIVKIYYKDNTYEYKIDDVYIVKKDGNLEIKRDEHKKTVMLVTCTKNSDTTQTVYVAYEN